MKKRFFLGMVLVALAASGIASQLASQPSSSLTPLQMQNIEVLTNNENEGVMIPCHSQAIREFNRRYVDCADCVSIEGWKAQGTEAACRTH